MYNVLSGEIQSGKLYKVAGVQSVVYDAVTYVMGNTFRGVSGVSAFTYSGSGTQEVNEVLELQGVSLELFQNEDDKPLFDEVTNLFGMSLEMELNEAEKIVQETTEILGMSLELVDYPFYSFIINEERFSQRPD